MADHQIVIAGFGGQGLLFSGKVLAYAGLIEGRELSWLPSYGPEMRGGTANCNVILSDAPVGSPIVNTPNVLMVMNNPSLDKYENAVQPGGKIFLDSTLIARKVTRTDVEAYYVPATKMAMDMGMPTLANMILLGALISKTGCVREESLADALHKVIPARKADLFRPQHAGASGWEGVRRMKATCIQMDMLFAQPEENFAKAKRLIREAMASGPDVVVLPETWNTGFFPKERLSELAERDCARVKRELGGLAAELGVNLVAGSVANARRKGL